jgi:hypothetical protein
MRKAWGWIAGICVFWTLAYVLLSVVAFFMYFIAAFLDWAVAFYSLSVVGGITLVAVFVTLAIIVRAITKAIFSKDE